MRLTAKLRTIAACVFAAAGISIAAAGAASASQAIYLTDTHGVLTTGDVVYPGETLTEYGYGTGTFTIESVTADGPQYRVTLNAAPDNDTHPLQEFLTFDFHT